MADAIETNAGDLTSAALGRKVAFASNGWARKVTISEVLHWVDRSGQSRTTIRDTFQRAVTLRDDQVVRVFP